jgi:deazaflavin-dependent oxidoreductase (nitroreductase family)
MSTRTGAKPLSLREKVGLFLHRQADRRLSRLGVWVMRRTRGSLADRFKVHALVLTTVGRRSGRPRDVVLQYFPDGDDLIVAAANDGGPADPAWYLNLRDDPAASVEIGGIRTAITAHELAEDEATGWWGRILELSPDYERYARATSRAFPIVRLSPSATAASSTAARRPASAGQP